MSEDQKQRDKEEVRRQMRETLLFAFNKQGKFLLTCSQVRYLMRIIHCEVVS